MSFPPQPRARSRRLTTPCQVWLHSCWVIQNMFPRMRPFWLGVLLLFARATFAERINHEGRTLGPPPVVTEATRFNTTNADAILAAMQIFPATSAWNENISTRLPREDETREERRLVHAPPREVWAVRQLRA